MENQIQHGERAKIIMKIYWYNGRKNVIGEKLRRIRRNKNLSQNDVAALLQLEGLECDRLTILRIESGKRFVPDYEIKMLCTVLGVSYAELLD